MSATNNIHFACPKCGGHRLMLVESAVCRSVVTSIELDGHQLRVAEKETEGHLCGDELGYRCMDCRYPDCTNTENGSGFLWPTLKDVQEAGAISWPTGRDTVEHKCMICFADGKMIPIIAVVHHPGSLSAEDRATILKLQKIEGAILISQSDSGIRTLSCSNWKRVKRHIL